MAKKWTRRERIKHLKEKYYKTKEKAILLAFFVVVFAILLAALYFGFQTGAHPALLGLLIIILLILMAIAIFAIDLIYYSGE